MSKQFTTGTITGGTAAANGQLLIERLRDDVVAHPAWELVEEYTPGGGTVTWYVFKCLSAGSGLPYDFYVIWGRIISTGELRAFICEGYNAGTHTATGYGMMNTSATSTTYDSEGRNVGTTQVLGTSFPSATGNAARLQQWVPSSSSTLWWIIVEDDAMVFATSVGATFPAMFDLGTYIPMGPLANPMPLVAVGSFSNALPITRNPAVAGLTSIAQALNCQGNGGNSSQNGEPYFGYRGNLSFGDGLQGGKVPAAEGGLLVGIHTAIYIPTIGRVIGKHKRMRIFDENTHPAGFNPFNDAFAIDGTLWMAYKFGDSRLWDTGVAA